MKKYRLWICRECKSHHLWSGLCGLCGGPTVCVSLIEVEEILKLRNSFVEKSSPVPRIFIEQFVDSILSK